MDMTDGEFCAKNIACSIDRMAFVLFISFFFYCLAAWIGMASHAWLLDAVFGRPFGKFFPWYDPVYLLASLGTGPVVMLVGGLIDIVLTWLLRRWTVPTVAHAGGLAAAFLVYPIVFLGAVSVDALMLCMMVGGATAGVCRAWLLGEYPRPVDW